MDILKDALDFDIFTSYAHIIEVKKAEVKDTTKIQIFSVEQNKEVEEMFNISILKRRKQLDYDWSEFDFYKILFNEDGIIDFGAPEFVKFLEKQEEYKKDVNYDEQEMKESLMHGTYNHDIVYDEHALGRVDLYGEGFYNLKEAYEMGILTETDIKNISYFRLNHNAQNYCELVFGPSNKGTVIKSGRALYMVKSDGKPTIPLSEELDSKEMRHIRNQVFASITQIEGYEDITMADIECSSYTYGVYDGYLAISISIHNLPNGSGEICIGDTLFNADSLPILWKMEE